MMEMPVPCNSCGEWIELNDGRVCHRCRQTSGMCRECWVDHEAWHEARDNREPSAAEEYEDRRDHERAHSASRLG